jgi:dTDP-4-amino-4,6-dideoxygalactose transaminase
MPIERDFLPFARPSITDLEKEAALEVLSSGWLTTGPRAKEFESAFAAKVGVRHAVALNSATAALHLALDALGVGPGDEIILPTWTFAATAEVVLYRGATPVLVDVDPKTLIATPDSFMAAVTSNTKAAIAVHFAGLPAFIDDLVERLNEKGVALVEDAAHAFPSRVAAAAGRYAGAFGVIGAYSFYATKTITTGEGGMLVTDTEQIADRARMMSLHGISRDAWKRYTADGSWSYDIEEAGYKYNMTDLAAAIGLAQLARAEELFDERKRLASAYLTAFAASPISDLIDLPVDPGDGSHAWHLFVVRLRLEALRVDRAEVIAALRERGIGTSVHFIPLHLHPLYRRLLDTQPETYPVSTAEAARVISLPLWPGMGVDAVARVVHALEDVLQPHRS